MKIIVTHTSPDWDAITSVWLLKKYLAGWQDATVRFVPAGERLKELASRVQNTALKNPIEMMGEDEVIHVDTGLGPLDHHQTSDDTVSAASLTWDFVRKQIEKGGEQLTEEHTQAVSRIVNIVVEGDHFKEVFWPDAASDRYEFGLWGVLEGMKFEKQNQDDYYVDFGIQCLNALAANFENRIWAEKEINEKGIKFATRFGPGIGFETLNDTVLKLSQKMGYVLVVRKDPRKNYVRIKALPNRPSPNYQPLQPHPNPLVTGKGTSIDLTLAYEQLKKIDPEATWFLHVSKKMLLNGSPKNPKMRPTKLSLGDIIKVLEKI